MMQKIELIKKGYGGPSSISLNRLSLADTMENKSMIGKIGSIPSLAY